jgi:membrane associated rhomboid family serine protease
VAKLRITYNSPVVLTFALAAVVVFLLPESVRASWFVAHPKLVDIHSYVGLFTYILGHATWQHLLGNFMFILLIGPILEERHGSFGLLIMILITALVGGLANLAFSSTALLGASGVVFMMILLASMANAKSGEIPLTLIIIAIVFMGGELVAEFKANDGISHTAHLVGGAVGGAFGFLLAKPRGQMKKSGSKGALGSTAYSAKSVLPADRKTSSSM